MSEHRTQKDPPPSEVDDWIRVIDRVPYVSAVKRDLLSLRRMLYDRRAPRVAVIGARASGRTSLANALLHAHAFGDEGVAPAPQEGTWVKIDADGRRLEWLELPGADVHALMESARRAFEEALPDVVLAVVTADATPEVRGELADAVRVLRDHLEAEHRQRTAVLVVLTMCDRVAPRFDPIEQKRGAVDAAVDQAREAMRQLNLEAGAFVPVAAQFEQDGNPARWNVAALAEAIVLRIPDAAQLEAVRAFEVSKEARREVGRLLVNSTSALAVTIGLAPIPFADALLLLPLQVAMVSGIAYLSGRAWDRRAATEWLASLGVVGGAGFGLRWGAQQLVKLIPGAGTIVGAGIAGAGTLAIGRSALAYFIDGPGRLTGRPELRAENP